MPTIPSYVEAAFDMANDLHSQGEDFVTPQETAASSNASEHSDNSFSGSYDDYTYTAFESYITTPSESEPFGGIITIDWRSPEGTYLGTLNFGPDANTEVTFVDERGTVIYSDTNIDNHFGP